MSDWFAANKNGLRQIAERLVERRGFGILGGELYQNVMDTDATECRISIKKLASRPLAELVVSDNGHGFRDLSHAWTIFAPSEKKCDPTKSGRFNVGEKVVLSFCKEAQIHTTSGTVIFDDTGRKEHPRRKREQGTEFRAIIDCTQERYNEFLDYMQRIIVRDNLLLVVNEDVINQRHPICSFEETLQTEISDDNGYLRKSQRKCEVRIYEVFPNAKASLYELGVPVVETNDRWDYCVMQKIPLNTDRDNVTPAYLRQLRVLVLNEMHSKIEAEDTTATWVNEAASCDDCSNEAAETFREKKYGKKSVAFDPTNPEANAEAVAHEFTVIPSRGLTPGQRANLYRAGTLQTSSQAFPTAGQGAYSNDPDAIPVEVIPVKDWTQDMRTICEYTVGLGERLMGVDVAVSFVKCTNFGKGKPWSACFGRGHVLGFGLSTFHYNVAILGKQWFEKGVRVEVNDLIIHEFGHQTESNHLDHRYHEALTLLGAKLADAILTDPQWFAQFVPKCPLADLLNC